MNRYINTAMDMHLSIPEASANVTKLHEAQSLSITCAHCHKYTWTRHKWALIKTTCQSCWTIPTLPHPNANIQLGQSSYPRPPGGALNHRLSNLHISWIIYDSTHIKFSSTLSLPGCLFWRATSMHGKAYGWTQPSTRLNRFSSNLAASYVLATQNVATFVQLVWVAILGIAATAAGTLV